MLSPELHAFNNYMLCLLLTKLPSLKLPVYENVVRERLPISFAAPYAWLPASQSARLVTSQACKQIFNAVEYQGATLIK